MGYLAQEKKNWPDSVFSASVFSVKFWLLRMRLAARAVNCSIIGGPRTFLGCHHLKSSFFYLYLWDASHSVFLIVPVQFSLQLAIQVTTVGGEIACSSRNISCCHIFYCVAQKREALMRARFELLSIARRDDFMWCCINLCSLIYVISRKWHLHNCNGGFQCFVVTT